MKIRNKFRKFKQKNEKERKFFLLFFVVILFIFFILSNLTLAGCTYSISSHKGTFSFSIDINEVMDCVERRYGYDQDALRRSKKKESVPTVEIYFDITEPKEGEKVTATASPRGFKNPNEELYYTWYVIHYNENGEPQSNINDGMIEAMGILARGGYDWQLFNPDKTKDEVYDGVGDPDYDSFKASIGGLNGIGAKNEGAVGDFEDQHYSIGSSKGSDSYKGNYSSYEGKGVVSSAAITRCYRHNFGYKYPDKDTPDGESEATRAGRDLIVECKHKFPSMPSFKIGDGSFNSDEEKFWGTDPNNPDTDGDGILDEADLAGLNQQQFTWTYQKGDRVGVVVEGISMLPINEDTNSGYYKIMWAAPGICSYKARGTVEGNECKKCMKGQANCPDEEEGKFSDYGFNYLADIAVDEVDDRPLQLDLKSSPQNPQFDPKEPDLSDQIKVISVLKDDQVNEDYVYYEWFIQACKGADFQSCDDSLVIGEDIDLKGHIKGTGIKEINFSLKKDIFGNENKKFIKVTATVQRYKNDKVGIASIFIPIYKNELKIKFFKTKISEGKVIKGEEICSEGNYKKLCPVYPFQILAAEIDGDPTSINWQYNKQVINPPLVNIFEGISLDQPGKLVYFPVLGEEGSVAVVSATTQKNNSNNSFSSDLISERMISIHSPLAVIVQEDKNGEEINNSGQSDVFEVGFGEKIFLKVKVVPDYLELANEKDGLLLQWFINDILVSEELASQYPELEINTTLNTLNFKNNTSFGSGYSIKTRVIKSFSSEEIEALENAWNINVVHKLFFDRSISTKTKFEEEILIGKTDLKYFWASTFKNAPEYLIFSIRIGIALTLIFGLIFGLFNGGAFSSFEKEINFSKFSKRKNYY